MYIRPIAAIAILFVFHPLVLTANDLPHPANSQSEPAITNKTSSGENTSMSDREKAGLRGPVQQCTEERTTPAFENFTATSYVSVNKNSPEGRIIEGRDRQFDRVTTRIVYHLHLRFHRPPAQKDHDNFWFAR